MLKVELLSVIDLAQWFPTLAKLSGELSKVPCHIPNCRLIKSESLGTECRHLCFLKPISSLYRWQHEAQKGEVILHNFFPFHIAAEHLGGSDSISQWQDPFQSACLIGLSSGLLTSPLLCSQGKALKGLCDEQIQTRWMGSILGSRKSPLTIARVLRAFYSHRGPAPRSPVLAALPGRKRFFPHWLFPT